MNDMATASLQKDSTGAGHIVFFVIAAAAPLTAVVGATPAAFAFGNGAGLPGTFIVAGLIYLLFGASFTMMTRMCGSAGGFYGYIGHSLGWATGVGGAFVAIVAYTAIQTAIYGLFSYFVAAKLMLIGLDVPWWGVAIACVGLVHWCGARDIAFSGRLLGVLMLGEVLILLALDIAILAHTGREGLEFSSFTPGAVGASGIGISLVFVIASYVGFEATTIFSEEARDPARTIPRATYIAVLFITLFYALSTWAMVQFHGAAHIGDAARANPGELYFAASRLLLGGWPTLAMETLLLTSLFASQLAFHNTITRYLFALARDGLIFKAFARTHPRFRSPHVASMAQSLSAIVLILIFAVIGADPYAIVFSWMSAFATIGILAVQCLVAVAVLRACSPNSAEFSFGRRILAPILSGVGLALCLLLVIANLPLLAGSDSLIVRTFPIISLGVGIMGAMLALRLRRLRPDRYASLARSLETIS